MDPSTNYYKTKRTLLLFVGALLLAVFAGFKIADGKERPSFLPFQLERPDLLGVILFVAVIFYLFQFSLQWAAQSSDIQKNRFHKIDFVATATIGSLSIICYVGSLVLSKMNALASVTSISNFVDVIRALFSAGVGGTIAFVLSKALEKSSATFGRWIRGKEASEDQKLMQILTSKEWMFHFNPQNIGARKKITFADNGAITVGKNKNENAWRVRNGLLEILNSEGRVFSRFTYDPSSSKFVHTNDEDTLSIRSQYIFRAPRQSH